MLAKDFGSIRLESSSSGLATMVFSQGERGNPFDPDFCRDFKDATLELWNWKETRAVLIRAEGKNFSVGGDLKAFYPRRDELSKLFSKTTSDFHTGLSRFWHLPVPVVVEARGVIMGGAVALLAGCDLAIVSESSRFGAAFPLIGLSCDSGASATLSFRMGPARARLFVLRGEILTSPQAMQCGLVDEIIPDADLSQHALEAATMFAAGPTLAYGEIKRLFLGAGTRQFESILEDEALTLVKISETKDAQEGIAAFVEKRKAIFTGK